MLAAVFLVIALDGCVGSYREISLAEYRELMKSPDNVSVERKGEWTLVTVSEPWQCVHSSRGSCYSIASIWKIVAAYRIRTSEIGDESIAEMPGREDSPRGDR